MSKLARTGDLWNRMLTSSYAQGFGKPEVDIYALDPGETTGRCIFDTVAGVMQLDHLETKQVVQGYEAIRNDILLRPKLPQVIICEDYKIYSWKADDHKWGSLHTPQLIGAIKVLCHQFRIPLVFQMAVQAKGFVTDEIMEKWGVYVPGMKHARDAQRHALYYKLLGSKPYTGKGAEHVTQSD